MPWELPSVLGEERAKEGLRVLSPPGFIEASLGKAPANAYGTIAALEATFYLRNQLLRDSDWASMSHSLELRTPLVDVQLLTQLAPYLVGRTVSSIPKIQLANAPTPAVPKQVTHRPKSGFSLPMDRWINKSGVLDNWRRSALLSRKNCHWSRRMAYSLATELISE
jgi:asparagine synthase (glutamine-hydrolysing)